MLLLFNVVVIFLVMTYVVKRLRREVNVRR